MWPSLIEKAYVQWKCHDTSEKSYISSLEFIKPHQILKELTGIDPTIYDIHAVQPKQIFDFIMYHCQNDFYVDLDGLNVKKKAVPNVPMLVKTKVPMIIYSLPTIHGRPMAKFIDLGIFPQHSYTILGCIHPNIVVLRDPRADDCPRRENPEGIYRIFEDGENIDFEFKDDDGIIPISVDDLQEYFEDICLIDPPHN